MYEVVLRLEVQLVVDVAEDNSQTVSTGIGVTDGALTDGTGAAHTGSDLLGSLGAGHSGILTDLESFLQGQALSSSVAPSVSARNHSVDQGLVAHDGAAAEGALAGTVGDRSIGYADAGAYGVAVIFGDVNDKLKF